MGDNNETAFGWPKGTVKAILAKALVVVEAVSMFVLMGFGQWELVKILAVTVAGQASMALGYYFGKTSGT